MLFGLKTIKKINFSSPQSSRWTQILAERLWHQIPHKNILNYSKLEATLGRLRANAVMVQGEPTPRGEVYLATCGSFKTLLLSSKFG